MSETVFVAVLEHEHGTEMGVRRTQESAEKLLIEYMQSTVSELEDYASESDDLDQQSFQVRLAEYRDACEEGDAETASQIYNALYEECCPESEPHHAWYRECPLET